MVIKSKKTNFRDRDRDNKNKKHCRKTKKKIMRGGDGETPKLKRYTKISKIWTKPEKFAEKQKRHVDAHHIKKGHKTHVAVQLTPEQLQAIKLKKIVKMLKNHDKSEKLKEQQRLAQEKAFAKQRY